MGGVDWPGKPPAPAGPGEWNVNRNARRQHRRGARTNDGQRVVDDNVAGLGDGRRGGSSKGNTGGDGFAEGQRKCRRLLRCDSLYRGVWTGRGGDREWGRATHAPGVLLGIPAGGGKRNANGITGGKDSSGRTKAIDLQGLGRDDLDGAVKRIERLRERRIAIGRRDLDASGGVRRDGAANRRIVTSSRRVCTHKVRTHHPDVVDPLPACPRLI